MKKEGERKPNPPDNWPELFVDAYRVNGNITKSAKIARVTRQAVLAKRKEDEAFDAEVKSAQAEALDELEEEMRRRAMTGVLKPVFYKGKKCGTVREYSDTLLIVLAKANGPEKFRETTNVKLSGDADAPVKVLCGVSMADL